MHNPIFNFRMEEIVATATVVSSSVNGREMCGGLSALETNEPKQSLIWKENSSAIGASNRRRIQYMYYLAKYFNFNTSFSMKPTRTSLIYVGLQ
jgi:hypothetical protein